MIRLWREGWKHPLFRPFASAHTYASACGTDSDGGIKCYLNIMKLSDSGYPGQDGWKGGNGGFGPQLGVAWCTAALLGQATRLGRSLALCLQQTGDQWGDNDRLFNYGFRYLFTPDYRGGAELAGFDVNDFALRSVSDTLSVSAAIDGKNHLRLDTWQVSVGARQIAPVGTATVTVNDLASGTNSVPSTKSDLFLVSTAGEAEADYLSGHLDSGLLRLNLWRVAEEPGF